MHRTHSEVVNNDIQVSDEENEFLIEEDYNRLRLNLEFGIDSLSEERFNWDQEYLRFLLEEERYINEPGEEWLLCNSPENLRGPSLSSGVVDHPESVPGTNFLDSSVLIQNLPKI